MGQQFGNEDYRPEEHEVIVPQHKIDRLNADTVLMRMCVQRADVIAADYMDADTPREVGLAAITQHALTLFGMASQPLEREGAATKLSEMAEMATGYLEKINEEVDSRAAAPPPAFGRVGVTAGGQVCNHPTLEALSLFYANYRGIGGASAGSADELLENFVTPAPFGAGDDYQRTIFCPMCYAVVPVEVVKEGKILEYVEGLVKAAGQAAIEATELEEDTLPGEPPPR